MAEPDPPRSQPTAHLGVLAVTLFLAAWLGHGRALGPLPLLAGTLAYLASVAFVPALGRTRPDWRLGHASAHVLGLTLVLSALTAGALVLWRAIASADLADLRALVPPLGTPGLVALGAGFALANAAGEELIFRGVLLPALESETGAALGVGLHAIVFGALHAGSGFPRGASGFVLAALFALSLAGLKRLSGGLLAPWLVHVVADATIFALVVGWA